MGETIHDIFGGLLNEGEEFTSSPREVFQVKSLRPKHTQRSLERAAANAHIVIRPLAADEWQLCKQGLERLVVDDKAGPAVKKFVERFDAGMMKSWIEMTRNGVYGIFDEKGFAGIFTFLPQYNREGELSNVWLDDRLRGRGVIDRIYDEMISWAKKDEDIKYLTMKHRVGNVASRAMAERMGFSFTEQKDATYRNDPKVPSSYYRLQVRF